jgi:hypothetical protein
MINKEKKNKDIVLIELSMRATGQGCPNHLSTRAKSVSAITQLIPKMTLNLVCVKGDEAIRLRTRHKEQEFKIQTFQKSHLPCLPAGRQVPCFPVPFVYASSKSW